MPRASDCFTRSKTDTDGNPVELLDNEYDPNETCCLCLKWKGTVMPDLLKRPLLWLAVLIYFGGHLVVVAGDNFLNLPRVDRKVMAVPSGLISFLIVFFTMNSYTRYRESFNNCKMLGGSIRNVAMLVKQRMRGDPCRRNHVVRLCVLAMHRTFRTLASEQFQPVSGTTVESQEFFTLDYAVSSLHWATSSERLALNHFRHHVGNWSDQPFLCISWANDIVHEAFQAGDMSETSMRTIEEQLMELRAACSHIQGHFQSPLPLPYWHMLNMLCNLFCLLFAYGLIFVDTWFAWVSAFIFILGIMGLREVGIMLAEPYGDDLCDIDAKKMTMGTFKSCYELLESMRPTDDDGNLQQKWHGAVAAAGMKEPKGEPDETDYLLAKGGPAYSLKD